jgi:4-carboxymuconolactone decarboxylase
VSAVILTPAQEALVGLSAALAGGRAPALDRALRQADARAGAREVEEALLQSYLFLGYPAALNGFARWRDLTGREAGPAIPDTDRWRQRGERVCAAVYGGQYDGLRANVRRLHPEMEQWMLEEGYGKVLGRPGLGLPTRELCIVALLAVRDAPRQLYSHVRGALNVGASPAAVRRAMDIAATFGSEEARARASNVLEAVLQRTSAAT